MRARSALLKAFLLLMLPVAGGAQGLQDAAGPGRLFAGGSVQVARPVGEFGDYVDTGFGLTGHFLFALDANAVAGIRVDGGFVNYGNETREVMLSPTIGGRITADLTTSNNILLLGAGPHLMLPNGRLRPYAFATAGLAYFVTESSLRGDRNQQVFATTNNYDDLTFAYGGGAGLYIPVRRGSAPISIDVGARYQRNGEARYLREGSIQDHPDGSISYTPIQSEADLFTLYLGISAGLRNSRDRR